MVRAFIRRTHIGHGVIRKSPRYSYIERVIDDAIFRTFMDMYFCMMSRPVQYCLPERAREVYMELVKRGDPDAEYIASEIAEQENSIMACSIAKRRGIDCITLKINESARPVFIPSEDTVYLGGYWGAWRDPDTGALHPTLIRFERRIPKSKLRRIIDKIHNIADEDALEKYVFNAFEKKYGRDGAWRYVTCVAHGGCEVEADISEDGKIRVLDVRPLTTAWKKYIETGELKG